MISRQLKKYFLFFIFLLINQSLFSEGFLKGTLVLTPEGNVSIEKLKKNDLVLTYNIKTRKIEPKPIYNIQVKEASDLVKFTLENNDSITVDKNHTFKIYPTKPTDKKLWLKAHELTILDFLFNANIDYVSIEKIEHIKIDSLKQKVYILSIKDNHNFFVGNQHILVHNCFCEWIAACIVSFLANYTIELSIQILGIGAAIICDKMSDNNSWNNEITLNYDNQTLTNHLSAAITGSNNNCSSNNGPNDNPYRCPICGGAGGPHVDSKELNKDMIQPQAPGFPQEIRDGFEIIKRWGGEKIPTSSKRQSGYPDIYGNVWVPSGVKESIAHGGVHWDVQHKNGFHTNVLPGGIIRGENNFLHQFPIPQCICKSINNKKNRKK
jgi:hypothetical protein